MVVKRYYTFVGISSLDITDVLKGFRKAMHRLVAAIYAGQESPSSDRGVRWRVKCGGGGWGGGEHKYKKELLSEFIWL
jgi:hypothetical protein